ncbi:MAG: c-type cytochrome [Pseudomonadota bacterium]
MSFRTFARRARPLPWICGAAVLVTTGCGMPVSQPPSAPAPPPAPLVGRADVGQRLYDAQCLQCHALDHHRIGPLHRGVVGRLAGSAPGYDYSTGLKKSGLRWTPDNLDRWLRDPDAFVQNQQMDYQVEDAQERADIIAYLATLR